MSSRILIVDDDASIRRLLSRHLETQGFEVLEAADGERAIREVLAQSPSIVLTDWEMPAMSGLDLCREIRTREGIGFTFVILMTAHVDCEHLVGAFEAGADDFIRKPLDFEEVRARLRAAQRLIALQDDLGKRNREVNLQYARLEVAMNRLQAANIKLHRLATTDELTGLTNRREALRRVDELWESSTRYSEPLSCIMIDIDHFKRFNDTYGHDVGDRVLKQTAATLKRCTRGGERTCRVGGEEFLLVCPKTRAEGAAIAAERMRRAVEDAPLMHHGQRLGITLSLGVAERAPAMSSVDDLLKAADGALYRAKHGGRNRVVLAGSYEAPRDRSGPLKDPAPTASGEDHGSPHVLVVDDDPDVRRFCERILRRDGLRAETAGDGVEALRHAQDRSPDVVVLDFRMPGMNGLEVLARLRSMPQTAETPIILMSGDDDDERTGLSALEQGADEFLRKPLRPREFSLRVRSMLRHATSRNALASSNGVRAEQAVALTAVLDFSCELAQSRDIDSAADTLVRTLSAVLRADCSALLMPEEGRDGLRTIRSIGTAATERIPFAMRGEASADAVSDDVSGDLAALLGEAFGDQDRPHQHRVLRVSDKLAGVLYAARRRETTPFSELEMECLDMIGNIAAPALADLMTRHAREAAQDSLVVALAKLAEHRDTETGRHLDRVTQFAILLARELARNPLHAPAINEEFLSALERAVPLHDIGKVAVPDQILRKPGKLSADEMNVMKSHVTVGSQTLRAIIDKIPGVQFLHMAEQIARCHHEWYDGHGYLSGLSGAEIPLAARITSVADVYDALTTERVYKKAFSHERARQILTDGRGKQFDPDVVDAFLCLEAEFARLAHMLADDPRGSPPPRPPPMPIEPAPRATITVGV
ncbi:MAG: response regulator [Phycisphaerales bacterium]|nr:response regulator [Phycisphaerales bacterium]